LIGALLPDFNFHAKTGRSRRFGWALVASTEFSDLLFDRGDGNGHCRREAVSRVISVRHYPLEKGG
jgi:hypothetical protein